MTQCADVQLSIANGDNLLSAMAEHLVHCDACQSFAEFDGQSEALLSGYLKEVDIPHDFQARLMTRVHRYQFDQLSQDALERRLVALSSVRHVSLLLPAVSVAIGFFFVYRFVLSFLISTSV